MWKNCRLSAVHTGQTDGATDRQQSQQDAGPDQTYNQAQEY